jgi:hypothetical protein
VRGTRRGDASQRIAVLLPIDKPVWDDGGMTVRRPDPRVDPQSNPPGEHHEPDDAAEPRDAAASAPPEPVTVERVALSSIIAEHSVSAPPPEDKHARVMSTDTRLDALERRMADNDWKGIASDLGSLEDAGRLPPNLGLAVALAHHELEGEGNQEAVAIGVRCMAALLGMPETSRTAGLLARRLFRKNPVRFRERKAPPPRVSLFIVAVTLVLGGTVGWLLSGGAGVVRRLLFSLAH